jgi:hypothetical protein
MRAPMFVSVRLDAALVRDLRRALCMEGDPFGTAPRIPQRRRLEQSARNELAVETAIRVCVRQHAAYRAALKGGA